MRRFSKDEDYAMLRTWYVYRGKDAIPIDSLPKVGFIINGVAAGFLMQTDTKSCILEPFISNPNKSVEERDNALTGLLDRLVKEAKLLGYTHVFGFSTSPTMIKRAHNQGFKTIEISEVVCKELKSL